MHILFVCTGNICRSPLGERLTRAFADEVLGERAHDLTASSAGTEAVVGRGMDPSSAQVLVGLGGDPSGFEARQLTSAIVDEADLVLTMTRAHRRKVLEVSPRALARTFTLLEAAELLADAPTEDRSGAGDPADRGRDLVAMLTRRRALRRAADTDQDDVPDPIGRPASVHLAVGDAIAGALLPLLEECAGPHRVGSMTADVRRAS
ncbi:hypothetical protein [Blastococcus mobilis]|uniref:Protein-tyrosine phosphatase n=1 Tax=Blastococcus mobilis TaxID=1938746 RepID=A0A238Z2J3_9ACTN|nr:hypothetical protein [Blastococcus mobilis]SNR77685.1 protein-tyrosine phosphatase [Blastococcus mobilis]